MLSVLTKILKSTLLLFLMLAVACLLTSGMQHQPAVSHAAPYPQSTATATAPAPATATNAPANDWLSQNIGMIIGALIGALAAIIAALIGIWPKIKKARTEQSNSPPKTSRRQQKYLCDHIKNYCHNVRVNPRIAQLQVLGMTEPLNIEDIYVHLRLYTNHMLNYALDEELHEARFNQNPAHHIAAARRIQERHLKEGLDPEKVIRQHKRIIIVGEPGAGKTTLLKSLTLKATRYKLEGSPHIPIYIELSTFDPEQCSNLLDLAMQQWQQHDTMPSTFLRPFLEQAMQKGNILMLLDGLDETAVGNNKELAKRAYMRTTQLIQTLVDSYPHLPILVTVRKATYHNQSWPRLQGFDELEIVEFTPKAIKTFVRNWFEASKISNQERMIKDLTFLLEHNARIEELASNPLLLSLTVLVYKQRLELPEHRARLYERCVETLLTLWDGERNIARQRIFRTDHKHKLLKIVAWHFHDRGIRYFPAQELEEVIASFLPSINLEPEQSKEILGEIVRAHGLIKEQAQGLYGFSHMTFQEYFVALYIDDCHRRNDCHLLDTLLARIDKPWWEEVLLLYAGITPDASPLLRALLDRCNDPGLQESLFHTNLLRAGHCLEAATVVHETHLRDAIVDQLFAVLETTPYASMQREIAIILARTGGKAVNLRLLQLLSSHPNNIDVAKNIADALSVAGNQALTNELLTLLGNKKVDHSVRAYISLALGRLGAYIPDIKDKMLALLTNIEEDWYVRLRLVDALGELGDPKVADELLCILQQHSNNDSIYYGIAIALGKLGNREVIPDLIELLPDKGLDGYARGGIVVALCMMADAHIVKRFLQFLTDESMESYVRRKIAKGFSELERKYVPVTELLAILTNPAIDPEVRGEIAATLCVLNEQSAIATLLQLLENKEIDPRLHISIVSTLGCLAAPSVPGQLRTLLKEPQLSLDLRGNILAALGMTGENSVLPDILAFFKDSTFSLVCPKVQINIIEALSHLGQHNLILERDIIQHLLKQLRDKRLNVYVGRAITEALGTFHLQEYRCDLLDLLADRATINPYIRQGIAEIVAHCEQDQPSLQRLFAILQETDIRDDIFEVLWKAQTSY